ncbi:MAG TPA: YtxH domain-containing protein [Smithella sp.]|jgi:gas vesicle protein|nr:YtxH domain-containing protein [Smithella sp.]OQC52766.1 MAG: YtxH-like protein [Deltaproteobacteria bacterium ADurb.Bin022]HOO35823.1 YtxH domain-containing protein [Smithella sp.]HPK22001.1 YtxH domain-containing protein [Smithella sp.]HPR14810.1 YtxH domain-containing protein [Smithella sp.]
MADSKSDFFTGLIVGGLIGVALGILFAPKSGKESREDIARKADELMAKAQEGYEKAAGKYSEMTGVESFRDYKTADNEDLA